MFRIPDGIPILMSIRDIHSSAFSPSAISPVRSIVAPRRGQITETGPVSSGEPRNARAPIRNAHRPSTTGVLAERNATRTITNYIYAAANRNRRFSFRDDRHETTGVCVRRGSRTRYSAFITIYQFISESLIGFIRSGRFFKIFFLND